MSIKGEICLAHASHLRLASQGQDKVAREITAQAPQKQERFVQADLPLIEIPRIGLLRSNNFGKAVLDEVHSTYKKFPIIREMGKYWDTHPEKDKAGVVLCANSFYTVATDEVLRQYGLRTASLRELEMVISSGCYKQKMMPVFDTALSIVPGKNMGYHARSLLNQIRERDTSGTIPEDYPLMVPLNNLTLVRDSLSEEGLSFKLRDGEVNVLSAPILDGSNQTRYFSLEEVDDESGLPKYFDAGEIGFISARGPGTYAIRIGDFDKYSTRVDSRYPTNLLANGEIDTLDGGRQGAIFLVDENAQISSKGRQNYFKRIEDDEKEKIRKAANTYNAQRSSLEHEYYAFCDKTHRNADEIKLNSLLR